MSESLNRKQQIDELKTLDLESLNPYRNIVIEEVALAIERFKVPFQPDTVASFAIYVRNMKK